MKKSCKSFISLALAFMLCLSAFAFSPFYADAEASGKLTATDVNADKVSNPNKLTLNSDSKLVIEETFLKKVVEKQTVSSVLSNFSNADAVIFDADGVKLDDSQFAGTGSVVKLINDNETIDALTIIVAGDTNGDSIIDTTDYLRIKNAFLDNLTISGEYKMAADVDGSTLIDTTDYVLIKSHFIGKVDIFESDESSEAPSDEPSVAPSEAPSDEPSVTPSEAPSDEPSVAPSEAPSDEPSDNVNYALNKTYTVEGALKYLTADKTDNGVMLTDGNIPLAETGGESVCFVGTGASNSVIIDLGQVYDDICKINVAGVVISGNRQYASVTIEISENGTDYTAISNYEQTSEYISGASVNYYYDLTETVSAKFVKITFVSESYVLALGEIEVYGGTATGVLPSEEPSDEPSVTPSEDPSEVPSDEPSEEPSSGESSDTRTNYAVNKTYYTGGAGNFLSGKEDTGSLLTDGYISPTETSGKTVGFVGTGAVNTVTIDLGALYVDINELDVCGVVLSGNRQYAAVTIEYSSNGVAYTALNGYKETCEPYSDFVSTYKYTLASDISARFVKFTFTSSNYVLTMSEIQVYGGNAPSAGSGDIPSEGGTDKLYIARSGNIWDEHSNCTNIVFPGGTVTGMYFYKIYAEYSPVVNGYVVMNVSPSHCSLSKYVGTNAIGIIFSYSPHSPTGRSFAKEQFNVWTNIRPGDILRPTGINVDNRTIDATGSIATYDLVTNAYFTVQYGERNVPTTKYNDKTIVALGDSVTANGGWTEAVSDKIGTKVINSGVGGDRATEGIARFESEVSAFNPDIVIIMFAINDCVQYVYNDYTLPNFKNELITLYNKCNAIGAKVIFMAPNDISVNGLNYDRYAPYGGLPVVYPQFIQAIKDVAAQTGAGFIDHYTPSHNSANPLNLLCDSVHPNDEGYAMIANNISNYLLENQDKICG